MVATGRLVVTAGQIGWNPRTQRVESENFAEQTAQALRNVVAVLGVAGAEPSHLVRLTWYITRREEYLSARRAIGAHYREIIGRHFPAMAIVVVAGLIEPDAKVEIEATAVIPE
jgi:enamine deaminase RidA (YjgF/YER057c/UK114 family)